MKKLTTNPIMVLLILVAFTFTMFGAPSSAEAKYDDRSDELPGMNEFPTTLTIVAGAVVIHNCDDPSDFPIIVKSNVVDPIVTDLPKLINHKLVINNATSAVVTGSPEATCSNGILSFIFPHLCCGRQTPPQPLAVGKDTHKNKLIYISKSPYL